MIKRFFAGLFLQANENVFEKIWGYANHRFSLGNFEISAMSLALGIGVLFVAISVSRALRKFLERKFERHHSDIDPGLRFTLLRLTNYIIVGIGLVFAFRIAFHADLTTLAVLFTALSVGIGFGLQFIAGDLAAGFILLFERPVRVGDFVKVGESEGKPIEGLVRSINLRTTIVMTNDGIAVIVPNSKLTNQNLINWTYENRRARISVPVGVAYDSDVNLVKETLLRAAKDVEDVLEEPVPSVQFIHFGDSTLDFRLLVWTARPRNYPQIKSEINYRIHQMFSDAKIEIPFPQQELRLRDAPPNLDVKKAGELNEKDEADAELVHH